MAEVPENQTRRRSVRSSRQGSNDLSTECGKAAYRAKGRRVFRCKHERGAHSARSKRTSYNTEQDGPQARGQIRQIVSKTLQCRTLAPGVPTYRTQTGQYDRRGRRG